MKKWHMVVCFLGLLLASTALWAQSVNINTADVHELAAAIKGVGEKTARAIVAYREQHGPFSRIEDLARVKGIGPATIEKNRARLSTGTEEAPQPRHE